MSQNIEMKELKDWLNDPTALKFKKILLNSRLKLLNSMSHGYIGQNNTFNKDLILSSPCGWKHMRSMIWAADNPGSANPFPQFGTP